MLHCKVVKRITIIILMFLFFTGCTMPSLYLIKKAHQEKNFKLIGAIAINDTKPNVRVEALKLLSLYSFQDIGMFLRSASHDPNSFVRMEVASTLSKYQNVEAKKILIKLLNDKIPRVKLLVIHGLIGKVDENEKDL